MINKADVITRPHSVHVSTVQVPKGDWDKPALKHVGLVLALTPFVARWPGKAGVESANFAFGDISLCDYGRPSPHLLDRLSTVASIVVSDEVVAEVTEGCSDTPFIQGQSFVRDPVLSHLAQVLLHEGQNHFRNGTLFADIIATAMAHYLWRRYPSSARKIETVVGGMAPVVLRRCVEYLDANLDASVRLADMAQVAGMSRVHLIRTFRASTGKTPHQFLLEQRVEKAKLQMRHEGLSLTEIALATGFANQHHLSRVFRRVTGVTPSQFRRRS